MSTLLSCAAKRRSFTPQSSHCTSELDERRFLFIVEIKKLISSKPDGGPRCLLNEPSPRRALADERTFIKLHSEPIKITPQTDDGGGGAENERQNIRSGPRAAAPDAYPGLYTLPACLIDSVQTVWVIDWVALLLGERNGLTFTTIHMNLVHLDIKSENERQ